VILVRALGAAALGAVVVVVVATATALAMPSLTTGPLTIRIASSFLAAAVGGYLSARVSPARGRLLTEALLVLLILGASVAWVRLHGQADQPPGFLPAVTLLSVIGVWVGAMIERATAGTG
jgi:hypothetical protein